LGGFAGDHLVEVAELAHELADVLPLGKDRFLRAGQLAFGVEGSLPQGRFDPVVFLARAPGVTALAVGEGLSEPGR